MPWSGRRFPRAARRPWGEAGEASRPRDPMRPLPGPRRPDLALQARPRAAPPPAPGRRSSWGRIRCRCHRLDPRPDHRRRCVASSIGPGVSMRRRATSSSAARSCRRPSPPTATWHWPDSVPASGDVRESMRRRFPAPTADAPARRPAHRPAHAAPAAGSSRHPDANRGRGEGRGPDREPAPRPAARRHRRKPPQRLAAASRRR